MPSPNSSIIRVRTDSYTLIRAISLAEDRSMLAQAALLIEAGARKLGYSPEEILAVKRT